MDKAIRKLIRDLRREGYEVARPTRKGSVFWVYRNGRKLTQIHDTPRKPEEAVEHVRQRLAAIESGRKKKGVPPVRGLPSRRSLDNGRRTR